MFNPKTNYDFRIFSNDKSSYITFTLAEYVHLRLSSLSCTVEVLDNRFIGWNTVWFSLIDLHSFIDELEELEKTRQGKACLSAMSNEDFNITFESYNKKGGIVVYYSLSNSKFHDEISIVNTFTGGFEIDAEYFPETLHDFKKFISVSELKSDIEFY